MGILVSVKVGEMGKCSVTKCGDRYYVLNEEAKEVGDCASFEAAMGLAELFAHAARPPEKLLAQEFAAVDQAPECR